MDWWYTTVWQVYDAWMCMNMVVNWCMITLGKLRVFWTHSIISGHWWQNEMLFDQGSFKVDTINFHSTRSLTWKRIIIFVLNRSETAETTFCTFMYFRVKTKRDIITTGDFFVSRWQYTFSQKYNFLIQVSSFVTVQIKMAKI